MSKNKLGIEEANFSTSISRGKKPDDGRKFRVKLKVNKGQGEGGSDELVITGRDEDIIKYAIAHLDASPRIRDLGTLDLDINENNIEEAFTKADFAKLETTNDHTEAAKKLVDMFGTSDEKKEMAAIKSRHEKTGYISGPDYSRRIQMTNKYYSRLK